jgi:hypothetical protein
VIRAWELWLRRRQQTELIAVRAENDRLQAEVTKLQGTVVSLYRMLEKARAAAQGGRP